MFVNIYKQANLYNTVSSNQENVAAIEMSYRKPAYSRHRFGFILAIFAKFCITMHFICSASKC